MHRTKNGRCKPVLPEVVSKAVFVCSIDNAGKFYWNLRSKSNGQTVAAPGENFETERACLASISNLKRDAKGAKITHSPTFDADLARVRELAKATKLAAKLALTATA